MKKNKLWLSTFIACTLFIGGIILFIQKVPFWSVFLGIPAIQLGIVFLIFTFEKSSTEGIDDEETKEIHTVKQKYKQRYTF